MMRWLGIVGEILIAMAGACAAAVGAGYVTYFVYRQAVGGVIFCQVGGEWCFLVAWFLAAQHAIVIFLGALSFVVRSIRHKQVSVRWILLVPTPIVAVANFVATGLVLSDVSEPGWFYAAWYTPVTTLGFLAVMLAMLAFHRIWLRTVGRHPSHIRPNEGIPA